jgi:hypothetical protein
MHSDTHQRQKQAGNRQLDLPPTRTGKERNTSELSGNKKATGQKVRQPGCKCRASWEALADTNEADDGRSLSDLAPVNADFEKLNSRNSTTGATLNVSRQIDAWVSLPRQSAGKRAWRAPYPHSEGR